MANEFKWVSHPVKESVKLNIVAFIGILIMFAGGFIWLGIPGLGLAIIIILLTLLPYFLPTEYIINEEGIRVKYLFQDKTYKWSHFKSYYKDNKGILLSPFSSPTRLENYRGLYVRYGKYRDRVTEEIEKYMSNNKE